MTGQCSLRLVLRGIVGDVLYGTFIFGRRHNVLYVIYNAHL